MIFIVFLDSEAEFFTIRQRFEHPLKVKVMSQQPSDNSYTEEELKSNSRADALAIFTIVVVLVGLLIFYVAS